jgi:lipopolysaccharide/colanic/teichoic acid biosynthesis glycosyltransferase
MASVVQKPGTDMRQRPNDGRLAPRRWVDVPLALLALLLLSPVMLGAALAVRLTSKGPVLFRQTRVGRSEKPFGMLKFRSMYVDADDRADREANRREIMGEAAPTGADGLFRAEHDPRVTPAGRIMRPLSIDELPQLFNVLRGEMAMVGPRPSLPWEVEMFTPRQRGRHACPPGLTGLWQVSGRNRLSMAEMLELDLDYVARRSLWLDLTILARTPAAVLFDRNTR